MPVSEDTEITLGTGKMLLLFFGLVALCAVFFGMGFSLGKNSTRASDTQTATAPGTVRPTAVKAADPHPPSDLTFYKAVEQKEANAELTPKSADAPVAAAAKPAAADSDAPPDPAAVVSTAPSNYFVQVAAVSKQEDAEALVEALKKKQYAAFAATPGDKLFHVQVGPFADIKDAEIARGQLVKDGYNPILKK
jgi:DedD protein